MNYSSGIPRPDVRLILSPLLPSLPAAAVSTQPGTAVLPLLSPILRQRVQLLSTSSADPWLRLLTYDPTAAPKLADIVQNGRLEPHPISGEVEVDWDGESEVRYRRLDRETFQALAVLRELGLFFRLVYCVGDQEGGGDGWRVGEIGVPDSKLAPFASFGGAPDIGTAEHEFAATESKPKSKTNGATANGVNGNHTSQTFSEEDDDDDYWARYDATPARTPAVKRSPAPPSIRATQPSPYRSSSAEDAYFAQYDSVQPAMDNHDPDEVVHVEPPPAQDLAGPVVTSDAQDPQPEVDETSGAWTLADPGRSPSQNSRSAQDGEEAERMAQLIHPRPASSASSNGSLMVAKLEETAERQDQSEFGVKQHVSRSIRSLFLLSRASGIDREEFERLVRTELDCLGLVED